ncbi:lysophospholipid acyltransferase family protein [Eubacteriaceae bacterium ES3]|nr:lysophospholipid acyltransferase family protein [Eubacteriaceae bacterium ES3]
MIYSICRVIVYFINLLIFNFKIRGKENIPKTGSALICPNHVSIYDPCVIASITPRYIHFMAKAELFKNPFLRWLLTHLYAFPVNRGNVGMETIKTSLKVLREQELLGIFPEGTRVKEGERIPPASGFVVFALKTKSPIIPVRIVGKYGFRRKIEIVVGEPIYLTEYYGKKHSEEELKKISEEIMDQVYELK